MVVTPLGSGGCTPSCSAWRFTYIAHVCWWIILWWYLRLFLAPIYSHLSTLLGIYMLYRPCFSLACVSHTYSHMYWCPHTHSLCGAYYDGAPSLPPSSLGGAFHLVHMVFTFLMYVAFHLSLVVLLCSSTSSLASSADCPPCAGGVAVPSPSCPCMEVHTHCSCVAVCLIASLLFYSYLPTLLMYLLLYTPCFSLACVSHTYSHMY